MGAMLSVQLPVSFPSAGIHQQQMPAARDRRSSLGPHMGGLSRAGSMIGLRGGRLSAGPHDGGFAAPDPRWWWRLRLGKLVGERLPRENSATREAALWTICRTSSCLQVVMRWHAGRVSDILELI